MEDLQPYETKGTEVTAVAVRSDDLSLSVLKDFLHSWKQGKSEVQTFSAAGIRYMAIELGISIVENTFKETSNEEGYYFSARARNLHTGQEYVAHVFQSKTLRNGKFDADAVSKGSTRVSRNALAGLLPLQVLKYRVLEAIKQKKIDESKLAIVQQQARDTLKSHREAIALEFGITLGEAFERAQDRMGLSDDWEISHWEEFVVAIQELNPDWFRIPGDDDADDDADDDE